MTNALKLSGITLPGGGYPRLINFVPPVMAAGGEALVGLYTFGADADASLRNWADQTKPLTKVGAPAIQNLGVTVGPAGYYDTGFGSTIGLTFLAIAKPNVAASNAVGQMIVSNFLAGTPLQSGDSLGFGAPPGIGSAVSVYGGKTTENGIATHPLPLTGADTADWNSFVGRIKPTGEEHVWWSRDGAVAQTAESPAATRAVVTSRTLRIGREYQSLFNGTAEIMMVAIFNRALTDAEVTANLTYLRAEYGPAHGVTTL